MTQKIASIRATLSYRTLEEFKSGYGPHFDSRGVFIRTKKAKDVGTRLRFELRLSTGEVAFKGEGIVTEVRSPDGPEPGMRIRFQKLGRNSKRLFDGFRAQITMEAAAVAPTNSTAELPWPQGEAGGKETEESDGSDSSNTETGSGGEADDPADDPIEDGDDLLTGSESRDDRNAQVANDVDADPIDADVQAMLRVVAAIDDDKTPDSLSGYRPDELLSDSDRPSTTTPTMEQNGDSEDVLTAAFLDGWSDEIESSLDIALKGSKPVDPVGADEFIDMFVKAETDGFPAPSGSTEQPGAYVPVGEKPTIFAPPDEEDLQLVASTGDDKPTDSGVFAARQMAQLEALENDLELDPDTSNAGKAKLAQQDDPFNRPLPAAAVMQLGERNQKPVEQSSEIWLGGEPDVGAVEGFAFADPVAGPFSGSGDDFQSLVSPPPFEVAFEEQADINASSGLGDLSLAMGSYAGDSRLGDSLGPSDFDDMSGISFGDVSGSTFGEVSGGPTGWDEEVIFADPEEAEEVDEADFIVEEDDGEILDLGLGMEEEDPEPVFELDTPSVPPPVSNILSDLVAPGKTGSGYMPNNPIEPETLELVRSRRAQTPRPPKPAVSTPKTDPKKAGLLGRFFRKK